MIRQIAKKTLLKHLPIHRGPFSMGISFKTSPCTDAIFEIADEQDFKNRVMESNVPVIVNFHTDTCEPCQFLTPVLRDMVNLYGDKIHLAEICADDHAPLLLDFEVTAVPAVLAIHNGMVTDKFVGLISDKDVQSFVKRLAESTET